MSDTSKKKDSSKKKQSNTKKFSNQSFKEITEAKMDPETKEYSFHCLTKQNKWEWVQSSKFREDTLHSGHFSCLIGRLEKDKEKKESNKKSNKKPKATGRVRNSNKNRNERKRKTTKQKEIKAIESSVSGDSSKESSEKGKQSMDVSGKYTL